MQLGCVCKLTKYFRFNKKMDKKINIRLKKAGLKSTSNRIKVLNLFIANDIALGYSEIVQQLESPMDKASLYRVLKSFNEKGILHEIIDGGVSKYAMCDDNCTSHKHHDTHAHFKCVNCQKIYCLSQPTITLDIPKGFEIQQHHLTIEGICGECNG